MSGTPTKQRTKDRKSNGTKRNVKVQIGTKIVSDIDIREWIINVWIIDDDAISPVLDHKVEHHLYDPFTKLCTPLWKTLLDDPISSSRATSIFMLETNSKSSRRPDFLALSSQTLLWLDGDSKRQPDWSMTVFPMEVQKTRVSKLRKERHPWQLNQQHTFPKPLRTARMNTPARHSMPPVDEEPSHTSSSKRSTKRGMNKVPQLAADALECFVATPRLYVVGIAQRDSQIVVIFRRYLHVEDAAFDFIEKPQYLVLVLFAMLKCTPRILGWRPGVNPYFHPGPCARWRRREYGEAMERFQIRLSRGTEWL
ncbi:uncharacterized protein EV420DRAFT_1683863 [Desarmillaria tabescens]|uniref:Fungal-type protein kinase domain-containing protein n=1 Tax=Armillaria tabescens TaxID=1929756 RepID=A0AA39J124_ARMTA|nr:uncharacterized protein EV420DRAFT_1683863 [Desarmillaria tabescens]KAK0434167.1 hypothetical protein EV420DRAFT_1683863 [Desarmillaria tabescens]